MRWGRAQADRLVTLTIVDSRLEAVTTIAMLKAYGIFAIAPEHTGKSPGVPIHVVSSDLAAAKALLADVDK